MDRDRVESWCQNGMLAVVVASLWFAAIAFGGVDLWARVVLQWLMALGLVFFAVRLTVARRPKLVLPPAFWAATLFMVYAVGRYWYADVEYVARQELIRVAICYLVFSFVVTTLHGQRSVRFLVYALIALATVESVYAIYQWAAKPGTVLGYGQAAQYLTRGSGTLFNPNHLAGLVGLALPISISIALISREPHWVRILVAYCAGVQGIGIFTTLSRGGIVAAAISVVLLGAIIVWKVRRLWIAVIGGIVFAAAVAFWVNMPESLAKRFVDLSRYVGKEAKDTRELIWDTGIAVWRKEPWFGAGPDHFDLRFREHRNEWLQTRPRRTHNDYLQLLADWGVVGASLGALFLGAVAYGLIRAWPHLGREESSFEMAPGSTRLAWAVGAAAGIVFLMIHSVVEFNLFIPATAIVAAMLFGICAASIRFATRAAGRSIGWAGRGLGLTAGLAILCALIGSSPRATAEARHLLAASQEVADNEKRVAEFKSAILAEPANPETYFALGENLRMRSFEGVERYETLAAEGIGAFEASVRLNPWDPFTRARLAMCLDWLGRHGEAGAMMETALKLDPNNKYIVTLMGWHHLQTGDLAKAHEQLERATVRMPHAQDPLAVVLFERVNEMLRRPR